MINMPITHSWPYTSSGWCHRALQAHLQQCIWLLFYSWLAPYKPRLPASHLLSDFFWSSPRVCSAFAALTHHSAVGSSRPLLWNCRARTGLGQLKSSCPNLRWNDWVHTPVESSWCHVPETPHWWSESINVWDYEGEAFYPHKPSADFFRHEELLSWCSFWNVHRTLWRVWNIFSWRTQPLFNYDNYYSHPLQSCKQSNNYLFFSNMYLQNTHKKLISIIAYGRSYK